MNIMYLLLFMFTSVVCAVINMHGPTIVNDYVNCINNIIEYNFIKPGILVFANTINSTTLVFKVRQQVLKNIHDKTKFIIKITTSDRFIAVCKENWTNESVLISREKYKGIPLADYYVVIVDNYKEFTFVASKIVMSRYWNPFAKFIVFIHAFLQTKQENEKYVEDILTCLFKYNVLNIIVLVPEIQNMRNAIVYSWKPYDPPKYCGYMNETAHNRLVVENVCECGKIKNKQGLYKNTIPINMHKCILHILALERNPFMSVKKSGPNIEKELVESLLRKFNFSSKYVFINSFRGERESAGHWNGALKKIISKKAEILLGGIFPDFDVHEDFECSSSYLADSYTWIVPRANPSPPWVAPVIVFKNNVWYSLIAGYIICLFSWKLLGSFSGDSIYNKSISHCILNTWISTLGFCGYMRPVKESLRVFFVFFNLYCIIFLTAYQTKLILVLQTPIFDQQIESTEDLVLSGLKFGGFEELHDLFYNSSDPFDNLIGERWIDVDNMTKALIDVTIHRNFSVLCSRLELAYVSAVMPELNDAFGKYTYFALEMDIFTVPLEIISLKGFPFMKQFSQTLKIYKELGINENVRRHFKFYNIRRRNKLLLALHQHQDKYYALSLKHLQGGFLALGLGVIIGTFFLLLEFTPKIKSIYNIIHFGHLNVPK